MFAVTENSSDCGKYQYSVVSTMQQEAIEA